MAESIKNLEDEIRNSFSDEGNSEVVSRGFKISIKHDGQIEVTELPALNLEQLKLPLAIEPEESEKGEKT